MKHAKRKNLRGTSLLISLIMLTLFLLLINTMSLSKNKGDAFADAPSSFSEAKAYNPDESLPQEAIDFATAPLSEEEQKIVNDNSNNSDEKETITINGRLIVYYEDTQEYNFDTGGIGSLGIAELFVVDDRAGTIEPERQFRCNRLSFTFNNLDKKKRYIIRTVIEPLPDGRYDEPLVTCHFISLTESMHDINKNFVSVVTDSEHFKEKHDYFKDWVGAYACVNDIGSGSSKNMIKVDKILGQSGDHVYETGYNVDIINCGSAGGMQRQGDMQCFNVFKDDDPTYPNGIHWYGFIAAGHDDVTTLPWKENTLMPEYDKTKYEFVGWFSIVNPDNNISTKYLKQVYIGDLVNDWGSIEAGDVPYIDGDGKTQYRDSGYKLVACFRQKEHSFNVNFKVADDCADGGNIIGSNGTNNDFWKNYTLKVGTNSQTNQNPVIGLKNQNGIGNQIEVDTTDFEWLKNLEDPKKINNSNCPYIFSADANDGYVFDGWTVYDEKGNIVQLNSIDAQERQLVDKNLNVVAHFSKSSKIEGTITSDGNGAPLENACVTYEACGETEFQTYTTTDSAGNYILDILNTKGNIIVSANGYKSKILTYNAASDKYDCSLEPIDDFVYLRGRVYKFFEYEDLRNREEDIAAYDTFPFKESDLKNNKYLPRNIGGYNVSYLTADGVFKMHVKDIDTEETYAEHSDDYNIFTLAVPRNTSGWLTISKSGYSTLKVFIPSSVTSVASESIIDVANSQLNFNNNTGMLIDSSKAKEYYGYDNSMIMIGRGGPAFSCGIAADDTNLGCIKVNDSAFDNCLLDVYEDSTYTLNYLSGEYSINCANFASNSNDKAYRVEPAPYNADVAKFIKYSAIDENGCRVNLSSAGKLNKEVYVFSQLESSFGHCNIINDEEAIAEYNLSFYNSDMAASGELPYGITVQSFDLRQWEGAEYKVDGNKLTWNFNKKSNSNTYNESTTIEAATNDNVNYDYIAWNIDGEIVEDGFSGVIENGQVVNVKAVAVNNDNEKENGESDRQGTAQTSDNIMLWLPLLVLALAFSVFAAQIKRRMLFHN